MINLKVIEKETWRLHLTLTIFSTSLASSFDYLRWKKMFREKVVLQGTTPPLMLSNSVWSLLLLLGPKNHNNLTFVKIYYCLFAGQGLSSSEEMTLPRNRNQKRIRRRRKEKTLLNQVMFSGEHQQFQKEQMLRLYANCYTFVLVLMVSLYM